MENDQEVQKVFSETKRAIERAVNSLDWKDGTEQSIERLRDKLYAMYESVPANFQGRNICDFRIEKSKSKEYGNVTFDILPNNIASAIMMLGPFHETAIKALGKEEFVFNDHYFVQDGNRVLVGKLPKEEPNGEWVFYAVMDKHTCFFCEGAHGKTLSELLPKEQPPHECCESELGCRCVARREAR